MQDDLWIEAIQEELKDIPKIKLSKCSLLMQEFITCCLQSESGMYFFEVDDFYERVKSKRLTREIWSDFECDINKYESMIFGAIEFDEVDPSMDCVVTCYQSLPYYFE